jgi:hypothetical protein
MTRVTPLLCLTVLACATSSAPPALDGAPASPRPPTTGQPGPGDQGAGVTGSDAPVASAPADARPAEAGASDVPPGAGPKVDRAGSRLFEIGFKANEADPAATEKLGTQLATLDTRVAPAGKLVVYLHGAGAPTNCGAREHGRLLASWGFHVLAPCYEADYGVGKCGNDIGGCRLEAFEGVDHSPIINVTRPNSIEERVAKGLALLAARNPQGDWGYFLNGDKPRWSAIIVSGISHGASSSGLIGMVRNVDRVVMLSGPLDTGQAWLKRTPMTPIARYFGFTHTGDTQHRGHLQAFADLNLPGSPTSVDGAQAPYEGSHRLVSAAPTSNGHSSTAAGGPSPMADGKYVFEPVWRYLYVER